MRYKYQTGVIIPFAQKYYKQLILVVAAVFVTLMAAMTAISNAATTVVTPGSTDWTFMEDPNATSPLPVDASSGYVLGPGTPPLGTGSAKLTVDGDDRNILYTDLHDGTVLADITSLEYSTYAENTNNGVWTPSLQIDVDYNSELVSDAAWQGRWTYEPYQTLGTLTQEDVWETWEPTDGNWWIAVYPAALGVNPCPQSAPCSWEALTALFPDATSAGVLFKAGGPWTGGFTGYVDAFTFATATSSSTYDFELEEPPVVLGSKEECKNGGWMTSEAPVFKNQGQCVSYFAKQQH